MTLNISQFSFAGGEISQEAYGRFDVEKQQTALSTCHNYIVQMTGGLVRRGGTKFIHAQFDETQQALNFPFVFSADIAYNVVFEAGKTRFFKNQGLILQGREPTAWSNLSTGGSSASISLGTIILTYSAGLAKLGSMDIDNFGANTYTVTATVGSHVVSLLVGTTQGASDLLSTNLTAGGVRTAQFTTTVNSTIFISFSTSTASTTVSAISISNEIYQIDNPFTAAQLPNLSFTESFDQVIICCQDFSPMILTRLGDDNWTLTNYIADEPAYQDINTTTTTLTPSAITGSGITITSNNALFAATDVGRYIRLQSGPDSSNTVNFGQSTGAQTYYNIPIIMQGGNLGLYVEAQSGAYTLQVNPTDYTISADGTQVIFGTAPINTTKVEMRELNAGNGNWGYAKITAFTNSTVVVATVINNFSGTNATKQWRLGAWSATTGYPKGAIFYQQRIIFFNTVTQPSTAWYTELGNIYNLAPDNVLKRGQIDSSSGFATPIINVSAILWMTQLKDVLLAGSPQGVASLQSTNSAAISAVNLPLIKIETNIPCCDKAPITVSKELIFIDDSRKRIYSLTFDFTQDGYSENELTLLTHHMVGSSQWKKISYAPYPEKIIWALTDDGNLRGITYDKSQEQDGWHRHTLGGTDVFIDSISVIPGAYSELWMTAARTINGTTHRYVEVSQPYFDDTTGIANTFCVDAGLTYSGSATNVVSGLDHLAGEIVAVLTNGGATPNVQVTTNSYASGTITIINYAAIIAQTVTIDAVVLTAGIDFTAATSNTITATNLATAINGNVTLSPLVTAVAVSGIVTITANAIGTTANNYSLLTSALSSIITTSGSTLTGGALIGYINLPVTSTPIQIGLPYLSEMSPIFKAQTVFGKGSTFGSLMSCPELAVLWRNQVGGNIGANSTSTNAITFRRIGGYYNTPSVPFSDVSLESFNANPILGLTCYISSSGALPSGVLAIVFKDVVPGDYGAA